MNVILNENQYKSLLVENIQDSLNNDVEENKGIIKKIVENVRKSHNLNLKFLLTWSVTIGGLIGPVVQLIHAQMPELNESEISLLAVGTILTYYYNNQETLNKVLRLIRDNGLINEFNYMLSKTEVLKDSFLDFIQSLNVNLRSMTDILAFTFLLSILDNLKDICEGMSSEQDIKVLSLAVVGYFGSLVSKDLLYELVEKIIKRFRK